jgi:xanthine/CO dehydrogenase XdhC/CoxF family maturation factor
VRDLRDVVSTFERTRDRGEHAALATVVRVVGSAYRRPGARMLLGRDGTRVGLVSGGCLEADLAERARPVLESGGAITVTYDARTDEDLIFGLGLGCEGTVVVLIERVPERRDGGHLALVARCLERRERLALATIFRSGGGVPVGSRFWLVEDDVGSGDFDDARLAESLGRGASAVLRSGRHQNVTLETAAGPVDALIEAVLPLPQLLVLGAGPDAQPVVRLAAALGFEVTVLDHRPAFARAAAFPGATRVAVCEPGRLPELADLDPDAVVLVMSHAYAHDLGYLRQLLGHEVRYLGVLGPRRRTDRILGELAKEGIVPSAAERARLHAPVGLDIGAETPEEIALSILAEIQAELAGRAGGRLRERNAPIHGGQRCNAPIHGEQL